MDRCLFYAKRGTKAIHELRVEYNQAKAAYIKASETRRLELKAEKMSEAARESQARLDNWDLFIAMEEAKSVFDFARDKLNDLGSELSKTQSESRLVIKEMEMSR